MGCLQMAVPITLTSAGGRASIHAALTTAGPFAPGTPLAGTATRRAAVSEGSGLRALRLNLGDDEGETRLTADLIRCMAHSLTGDHGARLVTIEGRPGAFCAGLDIESLAIEPGSIDELLNPTGHLAQFAEILALLTRTEAPVVALVDGPAMGGGVGLAAAADLVLATPRASFALPETLMGLIPAMIFPYVARRIGVPKARLLALGGKPLSAEAALRAGLVDEIVDDGAALGQALVQYARRFSRMDTRAVGAMKSLVARHFDVPSGYQGDALERFADLLCSEETRVRLVRFAAGESPWPEGSAL